MLLLLVHEREDYDSVPSADNRSLGPSQESLRILEQRVPLPRLAIVATDKSMTFVQTQNTAVTSSDERPLVAGRKPPGLGMNLDVLVDPICG